MCRTGWVEDSGRSHWQACEASGTQELTGGFLHGSQAPDGQEAPPLVLSPEWVLSLGTRDDHSPRGPL